MTRAERQAQTRAALIDAAEAVFLERGFLGSSVEEIARRAGFTRGAFYSNFATKEELFAELLQDRVYTRYRELAAGAAASGMTLRELGELNARMASEGPLFRLWLELLAHAARDDAFRAIAAGFWSGTRTLGAQAIAETYRAAGRTPPADAAALASAFIAMDVGLALQHFVDPEGAPATLWPDLYELLFGPLDPHATRRSKRR
ncbi:MAG TPA: helix-turn-helix domain-containing protein [Solirubrobacteraceae bacterium]|nr:helix-turn-helix domain-containing protein [Solirubrobacteraceae bacterium]